jgi:hypothetical protein
MPLTYKEPTPLPLPFFWTNQLEKIRSWRNDWGGTFNRLPFPPFEEKKTILFKKKKQNNKKVYFLNKIAFFIQNGAD